MEEALEDNLINARLIGSRLFQIKISSSYKQCYLFFPQRACDPSAVRARHTKYLAKDKTSSPRPDISALKHFLGTRNHTVPLSGSLSAVESRRAMLSKKLLFLRRH